MSDWQYFPRTFRQARGGDLIIARRSYNGLYIFAIAFALGAAFAFAVCAGGCR